MKTIQSGVQRGFVLVVAMLVLVLAVAVAEMVLRLGLTESLAASYEVAEQRADYIAEAGLSRTSAWLGAMAQLEPDFDRALDPALNTTCSYTASSALLTLGGVTADDYLPPFTDGSLSTDPGNRFIRVPYNDGAYFVRVDDNSDDGHEGWKCSGAGACDYSNKSLRTNYFPLATNNRETGGPLHPQHAAATTCPEAASPEIDALQDNPVRDRDKVVLVTVIGIYPGTSWTHARARKAYRLLVSPPRSNPGMLAGGSIRGAGTVEICGAEGGIHANGSISMSGDCACGEVSTPSGAVSGSLVQCNTPSDCPNTVGCAPLPPVTPTTVTVPDVNPWSSDHMNQFRRDGARQCYFFFASNAVGYFWDHSRTAMAGQACDAFPTDGSTATPRPCGRDAEDVDDGPYEGTRDPWCHCWVPVFYDNHGGYTVSRETPYTSAGPLYASVSARNTGQVTRTSCTSSDECNGDDAWVPQSRGAAVNQGAYNFEALCGGFTPGSGRPLWHTHAGTLMELGPALVDANIPDAVYFLDGAASGVVDVLSNVTATLGIITPMQVRLASNVDIRPPSWARTYGIVSGSNAGTLTGGASCELSSNSHAEGMLFCQGGVRLAANASLSGGITTKGDIELESTSHIDLDPSLPMLGIMSVRPLVWSDAAF